MGAPRRKERDRLRLKDCRNVREVGKWAQSKGYRVGEHPAFGGVHPVHTSGSLHYVAQALDINDDGATDEELFDNETESLAWLYHKILGVARAQNWPLDEMFFNGFGFIKELGYGANHPILGHDGHLHVGFKVKSW